MAGTREIWQAARVNGLTQGEQPMIRMQFAGIRAPRRLLALLAVLVACSNPATNGDGSGTGADALDPNDVMLNQPDSKKSDAPPLTDADKPDIGTDAAVSDGDAADDAAKADVPSISDVTGPFAVLCAPCVEKSACKTASSSTNWCVSENASDKFCSVTCSLSDAASCPTGFVCETVNEPVSGQSSPQCRPLSGSCLCTPEAIGAGQKVPCVTSNAAGSCSGQRVCSADGLSLCDAPTPAAETCNGVDDDCNGQTDDVSGKSACSNSNALGTCTGVITGCQDAVPLCNASTPAAETCNGVDDNCDGNIDEGLCDDNNPCTTGICGSDGSCGQIPDSGPPCDDGSACTDSDICLNGKCKGQSTKCDDSNPCTTDGCDASGGCTHTNNQEACTDDGNSCTIDACAEGACSHLSMGDGATCKDDGNTCTLDGCLDGTCVHTDDPFDPPCADDNNACTQDVCKASACAHVPVAADVTCTSDNNVCTDDLCVGGACQHPAATTETTCADDGIACTNDLCAGGKCTHPALVANSPCADDGLPCTDDLCQTGTCQHPAKPYGAVCADDGLPCTADTCKNGVCTHLATLNGQSCPDDGDPCTIDTCTAQGGCGHAIDPAKCEVGGVCYSAGDASPGDPCKQCIPGTSQTQFSAAPGKPCEDGDLCTVGETCSGGKCQGGGPKDCSALSSACGTAACEKSTGTCVVTPKNSPCDDGDVCTASDHCTAGKCVGTAKDCSPFDTACTVGTCQNGTCTAVPKVGGCDDGDACTLNDACVGTKCVGTTLNCSQMDNDCGTGACKDGVCLVTPKLGSVGCNDGNGCTFNDKCVAGLCVGTAVNCSSLDGVCAVGVCDPATTGCTLQYFASTVACTDGDGCTLDDHCDGAGKCSGTALVCKPTGDPCSVSYCGGGKCQISAAGDGNPCNDNSTCTKTDVCSGGKCTGQPIYDAYENNNSPDGYNLGTKTDCEGSSGLGASISPAMDIDFYHYAASDQLFCSIYPDVSLTGLAADYDLCVWFRCNSGQQDSTVVACDVGQKTGGGPNGQYGCCSTNSGTANEHVRHNDTCSLGGLGDDGGIVTIQVIPKNSAAANMCGGYALTWKAN